ncbi:MAG: hypothetical protein IEMM0008_0399 [bacterium]|nr:MAG: hypothetical protein IEMM0008_0399 [bacterium]
MIFIKRWIIVLLMALPTLIYPLDQNFIEGHRAYIQEDYHLAIQFFSQSLKNKEMAKTHYLMGVSYRKLFQCQKAKNSLRKAYQRDKTYSFASRDKYYQQMQKANDCLQAIQNRADGGFGKYSLILMGVLALFIFAIIIIIGIRYTKNRLNKRQYKEQPLSEELITNLDQLNDSFTKARNIISKGENQRASIVIEEIEDRCIALNDKLEELKYGLRAIDEESFKNEIEITTDMIHECLNQAQETQEV